MKILFSNAYLRQVLQYGSLQGTPMLSHTLSRMYCSDPCSSQSTAPSRACTLADRYTLDSFPPIQSRDQSMLLLLDGGK